MSAHLSEVLLKDDQLLRNTVSLSEYFDKQLNLIKDPWFRIFIKRYLDTKEKFTVEKPTSASGKYHPTYQNTYGGNGKHIKNVCRILEVFERAFPNLRWDELYTAAILHDLSKYDTEQSSLTNLNHAYIEADKFLSFAKKVPKSFKYRRRCRFIAHLIKWHDGRFNPNYTDKTGITENKTKFLFWKMRYREAELLHLADMVSANRLLEENPI